MLRGRQLLGTKVTKFTLLVAVHSLLSEKHTYSAIDFRGWNCDFKSTEWIAVADGANKMDFGRNCCTVRGRGISYEELSFDNHSELSAQ